MKTPKEFTDNIKNKTITEEMLEVCLYSVNKRAKNCRDKLRQYRKCRYIDAFYEEQYEKKLDEYYSLKDKMLSILTPVCIHTETVAVNHRRRIYDYEKEYKSVKNEDIVWSNCFFDYKSCQEVYFVDVIDYVEHKSLYYLYYETSNYSFHTPIQENDVVKYSDKYDVIDIGRLITEGKEIDNLISCQFVHKLIELIETGNYQYVSKRNSCIPV